MQRLAPQVRNWDLATGYTASWIRARGDRRAEIRPTGKVADQLHVRSTQQAVAGLVTSQPLGTTAGDLSERTHADLGLRLRSAALPGLTYPAYAPLRRTRALRAGRSLGLRTWPSVDSVHSGSRETSPETELDGRAA